jgi:hypothetical protein
MNNTLPTPYDAGYDHFLNGGTLDYEPINNEADRQFRAGWEQARIDDFVHAIVFVREE